MKQLCIPFLFFLSFVSSSMASPTDSISTVYRDGEFITYCQVWVKASDSISNGIVNDFDYQMCYNLDALMGWALKGLNLRKERNDLMIFYFKSTSYNKETGVLRGIGDVIVPSIITFPNIIVDSKLYHKKMIKGKNSILINLLYSDGFIKKLGATFTNNPRNTKGGWYTLETHIQFGWFFDIFITQKRFRSIMEWRLKRLIYNMKDEAERRENKLQIFKSEQGKLN